MGGLFKYPKKPPTHPPYNVLEPEAKIFRRPKMVVSLRGLTEVIGD